MLNYKKINFTEYTQTLNQDYVVHVCESCAIELSDLGAKKEDKPSELKELKCDRFNCPKNIGNFYGVYLRFQDSKLE